MLNALNRVQLKYFQHFYSVFLLTEYLSILPNAKIYIINGIPFVCEREYIKSP